jgi:hypothetical protein
MTSKEIEVEFEKINKILANYNQAIDALAILVRSCERRMTRMEIEISSKNKGN